MARRSAHLLCAGLLLALGAAPAHAQAAERAAERGRLGAERQRIEAVYAAEEAACGQRFAVTGCVEDARARRRAALAPLRERELGLDDVERQERAAARRQAIVERQRAQQQPGPDARPAPEDRAPRPRGPELQFAPRASESAPRSRGTAEATKAARRAEQAERRRQQVRADLARIQERLAEKAGQGGGSAPLPVPVPAASSPRAR